MSNGNGRMWIAGLSLICVVFGVVIGSLWNQVQASERYMSVERHNGDLMKIETRLTEIRTRLDRLIELQTGEKRGG